MHKYASLFKKMLFLTLTTLLLVSPSYSKDKTDNQNKDLNKLFNKVKNSSNIEEKDAIKLADEIRKQVLRDAESGDLRAQYSLGTMYCSAENYSEGIKWLKKSAVSGYPQSQNYLGFMYMNGQGVEQNHKESLKWFRMASDNGFRESQYCLGYMYNNGLGVKQDPIEAIKWYRKSAEQDYPIAQYNLGLMYYHGKGVRADLKKAINWLQKSADQGFKVAQKTLEIIKQGSDKS